MKIALALLLLSLTACTDAKFAQIMALGSSAHVLCYSGNAVIYDGRSSGKVARNEAGSDGYHFVDDKDGHLKEVSGNCVVTYD